MIYELPITSVTAKREHGAVSFEEIPIGGYFFFGGQYTIANVKTGPTGYKAYPSEAWSRHCRIDTLVYPDPSLYLAKCC